MQKLAFVVAVLWFMGNASAQVQVFLGSVGGVGITSGGLLPTTGLQVGSYNLSDIIGARFAFEVTPIISSTSTNLLQFSVDGLYTSGESIKFYIGPGLGLVTATGLTNAFVLATVGVDFDSHTTVSYFIEGQPRYYFGGQPFLYIRSGVNVHF